MRESTSRSAAEIREEFQPGQSRGAFLLGFVAVLQHRETSSQGKHQDFLIQFIIRGVGGRKYLTGSTTPAAECGRMPSGLET